MSGAGQPGAGGAVGLVVRRRIRAQSERLFALWTTPELLVRWWGPAGVSCIGAEIDLRVGGSYRIGNLLPDGRELWIEGTFEQIAPGRRLVYSWQLRGEAAGPPERVTVRFEPHGEETEVIVVHERIADEPTRAGHLLGWEGCLDGLVREAEEGR